VYWFAFQIIQQNAREISPATLVRYPSRASPVHLDLLSAGFIQSPQNEHHHILQFNSIADPIITESDSYLSLHRKPWPPQKSNRETPDCDFKRGIAKTLNPKNLKP